MIRLFKRDSMIYTPFDYPQSIRRLEQAGIMLTDRVQAADVIITRFFHKLRGPRLRYPWKKFLIWTHEPRFNEHFAPLAKGVFGLGDVHIMNVYTGDIFCDNFDVLGDVIDRRLEPVTEHLFPEFRHKTIAALMTRAHMPLVRAGRNIDLFALRTEIALAGHARGKVHIYGRGWPAGVAHEDSRGDGWHSRKIDLLKNYHFNLCFENTIAAFYCSEKIWDSIRAGCLPIYYGQGNRIYDDFPRDSFLDYFDFNSPEALFDYIDAMTVEELRERMNRCIAVHNRLYEKRLARTYYDERFSDELMERIIDKVRSIVDGHGGAQMRSAA